MFKVVYEIEVEYVKFIRDNNINFDEIVEFKDEKYKQVLRYYFLDGVGVWKKCVEILFNRKLFELEQFKYNVVYCLENLLRNVVIFVKGIKSNVQFDGKKYYVDVVVVELS